MSLIKTLWRKHLPLLDAPSTIVGTRWQVQLHQQVRLARKQLLTTASGEMVFVERRAPEQLCMRTVDGILAGKTKWSEAAGPDLGRATSCESYEGEALAFADPFTAGTAGATQEWMQLFRPARIA